MNSDAAGKKARNYDLAERTARFGESVLRFARRLPKSCVTIPVISQLVKAATSIGANYCEADGAESMRDFAHKIGVVVKEANETKYWLRMIATAAPEAKADARILWKEAKELHLIFASIYRAKRTKGK